MPMKLNPPPGWPPAPPGWVPPPGWQPDPSWPDPPPGWNLWVEDTAPREGQIRAAIWAIAGGGGVFLGSLLPFLSSSQPLIYEVSSGPKDVATFFGIILAALGAIMLAKSDRAKLISSIATLVVAALTLLILGFIVLAGIVGTDQSDGLGSSVHVGYSPQIGVFVSILGCIAAGIGAIMSLRNRSRTRHSHREQTPSV